MAPRVPRRGRGIQASFPRLDGRTGGARASPWRARHAGALSRRAWPSERCRHGQTVHEIGGGLPAHFAGKAAFETSSRPRAGNAIIRTCSVTQEAIFRVDRLGLHRHAHRAPVLDCRADIDRDVRGNTTESQVGVAAQDGLEGALRRVRIARAAGLRVSGRVLGPGCIARLPRREHGIPDGRLGAALGGGAAGAVSMDAGVLGDAGSVWARRGAMPAGRGR